MLVYLCLLCFVWVWCDICIFVLCLIVVPLPPGKNLIAIQLNNNNNVFRPHVGKLQNVTALLVRLWFNHLNYCNIYRWFMVQLSKIILLVLWRNSPLEQNESFRPIMVQLFKIFNCLSSTYVRLFKTVQCIWLWLRSGPTKLYKTFRLLVFESFKILHMYRIIVLYGCGIWLPSLRENINRRRLTNACWRLCSDERGCELWNPDYNSIIYTTY
jgi:hypothetical protein